MHSNMHWKSGELLGNLSSHIYMNIKVMYNTITIKIGGALCFMFMNGTSKKQEKLFM